MLHRLHTAAALLVAWAAAALISCRAPCALSQCLTRCGVYACSNRCEELQAAEDRAVAVFNDAGFDTCRELNGYDIEIMRHPDGGPVIDWVDEYGREIAGDTHCTVQLIRLGTDNWPWSAYSHEVRHAIDRCATDEHQGWLDGGVFDMIERAR